MNDLSEQTSFHEINIEGEIIGRCTTFFVFSRSRRRDSVKEMSTDKAVTKKIFNMNLIELSELSITNRYCFYYKCNNASFLESMPKERDLILIECIIEHCPRQCERTGGMALVRFLWRNTGEDEISKRK